MLDAFAVGWWPRARPRGLADLTPETLAQFLVSDMARLTPEGQVKRPTSLNALRTSIRTLFDFSHRAGYSQTNVARLVRRARCSTPPPRSLTAQEQDGLLAVLAGADGPEGTRDRLLILVMLRTGLRLGSTIALDVDDVDLDAQEIRVRETKGNIPHTVILPPALIEPLVKFVGTRSCGPLFTTKTGNRISARQVQRRLAGWLEEAGIDGLVTAHSLRHSFAMKLYQRTADLALVQTALGHRSIVSTIRYARCDQTRLRAAMTA